MISIDLLIIGAGPAGLSTALHLVQMDPEWKNRLLVLDKESHPRPKLCGGGVTRLGLGYLAGLGLQDPLPIPHSRVREARFQFLHRTVRVSGDPEIVIFHRQEFDHLLAMTAAARGIRIRTGQSVRSIERAGGFFRVATENEGYQARAVVGADGSRGQTRRLLDQGRGPKRAARLMEVIHPASEEAQVFSEHYALFDFSHVGAGLQGYTWDFPARVAGAPSHNRGIYDSRVARKRGKAGLGIILSGALKAMEGSPRDPEIQGHPIRWFSPRNRISGDRLLLVGDAAGAEPLFGEGIAPALGYGKHAAEEIHSGFKKNTLHFKHYKRRILFSRLGYYLLIRWWVAWWSYRLSGKDWFMHIMWTIGMGLAAINRIFKRNEK